MSQVLPDVKVNLIQLEQKALAQRKSLRKKRSIASFRQGLRRENSRHALKIFLDAVGARRSLYGVTLQNYVDVFEAIDKDEVRTFSRSVSPSPITHHTF